MSAENAEAKHLLLPTMSHTDTDTGTLSRSAKLTLGLSTTTILAISTYSSPTTTALLPIILTPTLLLLRYRSRAPLETLLWTSLGTATLSTPLLITVQSGLTYIATTILFGPDRDWFLHELQTVASESDIRDDAHRAQRAEFARRPRYAVFVVVMAFVLAGLCEELQKYISIALAVRSRGRGQGRSGQSDGPDTDTDENEDRKADADVGRTEYLMYGATAALSFAAIEMYMFVFASAAKSSSSYELARTVAERLCIGTAVHLLCGLTTALNMIKRDIGKEKIGVMRVVMRSVSCHGLVDFGLMAFSAVGGNVGWVHPEDAMGTLVCWATSAGVVGLLAWLVMGDLRKMRLDVE